MKKFVFYLIVVFCVGFYKTTDAQLFDSLKVIIKVKSSISLKLESRYSFINNELASINGIRVGVAFKRKLRFGAGVSWLNNDIHDLEYFTDQNNLLSSRIRYLKLAYLCVYADFVFYKTKRWQLSVPIQTGLGYSWHQYSEKINLKSQPKYFLWIYEPGISTQFKLAKWAGLGVDVNYRFALKSNKTVADKFSSPTYAFKILFWADQLFYELFPNSSISKKRGPSVW